MRVAHLFSLMIALLGFLCFWGIPQVPAQEESKEEAQYREDYERVQKIVAISDTGKRAEQLLQFFKDRPNSKMNEYAQGQFFQILEGYAKAENKTELVAWSERYIKLRPRVGETYYFYGYGLKNAEKFNEAMDALAKCYVLKNPISPKAKDFLDFIYKARNKGSLAGEDAIIKKAQQELSK